VGYLQTRLQAEVQKMLTAGHLRPGYVSHGYFDLKARFECGDDLVDYWHHPAETIYVLLQTLPYLPTDMQQSVKAYIQSEFQQYPPYQYNHIGWQDGAARELFDVPPEVAAAISAYSPKESNPLFVWKRNPFSFYTLWKYAEVFGDAATLFNASKNKLEAVPPDAILLQNPHVHNAFIAGYMGYLELEKLAGQPASTAVANELSQLMQLRATQFTKDTAYGGDQASLYCRVLSVSNNFMFMVPELAQYLRENALSKVQSAVDEYTTIAPYWFVALASEGLGENPRTVLYDTQGLFLAKALILGESGVQLEQYLDVPAFPTGDLFYIQKLVALLQYQPAFMLAVPPFIQIEVGESTTSAITVQSFGGFDTPVSLSATSTSPALGVGVSPTSLIPPGTATLTLNDTHSSLTSGVWATVRVTASGGGETQTADISVLVSGSQIHFPMVSCQMCVFQVRECIGYACRH
jgi:hypothetical protein